MGEGNWLAGQVTFDADGRYQVKGVLGAGAYGIVYHVLDTRWGQDVALKTLNNPTPRDRQWLKAEYRSIRDIVHPNLVRLHELRVDERQCFFTMDLVRDGEPFNRRLDFDRTGSIESQRTAIRRICKASLQLAAALEELHRFDKCHRDIKPSNILVTPEDLVVLLDFGLASPITRAGELDTQRGLVAGTLLYLPPEQFFESRVRMTADWYGMALVVYQTLTGRLPFEGHPLEIFNAKKKGLPSASTFLPAIPEPLDRLLTELLSPEPDRRPDGARVCEVLRELAEEPAAREPWLSGRPVSEPGFVGREEELQLLERAYLHSAESNLVVVEIVGPSGIGKSALVRQFLERVAQASPAPLVLEARCDPHESIPYKAFDAVIDDLTRYWIGLDDARSEELRTSDVTGALAVLFPELLRVPSIQHAVFPVMHQGDPRALRQSGFRALRGIFTQVSRYQPLILWVDDVQWADADSVALIEAVFGIEAPPPVLLLLSRRPEEERASSSLRGAIARAEKAGSVHRIDLAPLASTSAVSLARAILGESEAEDADAVSAIVGEAAGVPYLISELAFFAVQRRKRGGGLELATSATGLMSERLGVLAPEDRTLVELAAVSGGPQAPEVLLSAAGSKDRHRLRDLCVLRLLRWDAGDEAETLQIYHDRLREFVVDALPREVSVKYNASLVRAMEDAGSSDAERMLVHAMAAGDRGRAQRHAMTAARRAETALAFDQAARLYQIALEHTQPGDPKASLRILLAEALANAGHSTRAAPTFELALEAISTEEPEQIERRGFLRRRAGEQYLKAGRFEDGLRLMESFLAEAGVKLPKSGKGALAISAVRRLRLYLRGFDFRAAPEEAISPETRSRLDDLWAATTALSMMDPVRADGVGLLHFLEALRAGEPSHVARSLGYEAAFAALIGGPYLRKKAQDLLRRNREALDRSGPYERAFYQLGAGSAIFFHSKWEEAVASCDAAAESFRKECRGAEYEAAVAIVFSLQALGQAGKVTQLVSRIPEAIREADARGDLFAANNYRGGFHALGRVAAGQVDDVQADLQKVVETWKPGFYQMHAYHRVFAGVAADLYAGESESALQRIEQDWPELQAGLFLQMELPAMELRWTRARASLAAAQVAPTPSRRRELLGRVKALTRAIARSTAAAAPAHAALLRAGLAASSDRADQVVPQLRAAFEGYSAADMAIHREVTRWALGKLEGGETGRGRISEAEAWMEREGVPAMPPLVSALAPGVGLAFR